MWAATHSERNFHDPYTFKPERWMDKDNAVDKLGASNAFSLGPRGCIGKKSVLILDSLNYSQLMRQQPFVHGAETYHCQVAVA